MLNTDLCGRIERAFHSVRSQRALLYSPLPPLLLFAYPLSLPPPHHQISRLIVSARQSVSSSFHIICSARQRMGHGNGPSKQDGFYLAVGFRGRLVPRDGSEADFECGTIGQGEQLAC